ncbi:MAG: stage II sporulation protein R [Clostridia bacterium]|nr:stage II sporulation protein R [Clostridia bacterium]
MKKFLLALGIGFICLFILNSEFKATEAALASNVIRFHVLANSDEEIDQKLKLKVRDAVIKEASSMFDNNGDINMARCTVLDNLENIKKIAKDEIEKNGFNYDVDVSLGQSQFPTKNYGEIVLPAGSYEALKIEIGKAEGQNWWCVFFPPLCFVDESCVSYSSEAADKIKNAVGSENAKLLNTEAEAKVKIKFKAYEMWQSGKEKIEYLLK